MRLFIALGLLLFVVKANSQETKREFFIINSESIIKDASGQFVKPGKAMYLFRNKKCLFEKAGENQYLLKEYEANSPLLINTVASALPAISKPVQCLDVVDSTGKRLAYEDYSKLMVDNNYYLYPYLEEDGTANKFMVTSRKSKNTTASKTVIAVKMSFTGATQVIDENCNTVDLRDASEEVKNSGGKMRLVPIQFDADLRPEKMLLYEVPAQEIKIVSPKMSLGDSARANTNITGLVDRTTQYKNIHLKDLEFTDINGVKYTEAMLKDKIVVANFWFKNCKPCLDELPELNKLVSEFSDRKDIVFIAFNVRDNKETIQNFLLSNAYNYKQADASFGEPLSVKYALDSYPTHLLIDKKGIVIYAGITSMSVGEIKNRIKGL